jgi:predicted small integral membrane protein
MNQEHVKLAADGIAVSAAVASWMTWLPPIAALLSIIWLLLQIGTWVYDRIIKPNRK